MRYNLYIKYMRTTGSIEPIVYSVNTMSSYYQENILSACHINISEFSQYFRLKISQILGLDLAYLRGNLCKVLF